MSRLTWPDNGDSKAYFVRYIERRQHRTKLIYAHSPREAQERATGGLPLIVLWVKQIDIDLRKPDRADTLQRHGRNRWRR